MRSLHRPQIRIAIVCDNFSPHLSARKDKRVGQLGRGQQRRDRLQAHELLVDEPPRMPVHRVARVRRPPPAPHRQKGNRSLIRH